MADRLDEYRRKRDSARTPEPVPAGPPPAGGNDWMMHGMDPLPAGWTPMPERVEPMRAKPARRLPSDDDAWAYEMAWDGVRATGEVSGGRLRLLGADGREITKTYPELRELA